MRTSATLVLNPLPLPQPVGRPEHLYDLTSLYIGQQLWVDEQLVRVRSVYAPAGKPRWRQVAEVENVLTNVRFELEANTTVRFTARPETTQGRFWLKYQGQEVWVIYAYRFGQLVRYQGGTFRRLDARPSGPVPVVPRGAIEVAGEYAVSLLALLSMSNDKRYLAGEDLPEDFHPRHAALAIEMNEIAARCFWEPEYE